MEQVYSRSLEDSMRLLLHKWDFFVEVGPGRVWGYEKINRDVQAVHVEDPKRWNGCCACVGRINAHREGSPDNRFTGIERR